MAFLSAVQPRLVASRGCSTKANALPKAWRPSCRRAARCTPRAAADGSEEVSAAARLVVTKYIKPGQTIGLGAGTGLAMNAVLEEIARRIDSGELRGVRCVAASSVSASEAAFHGVPMVAEGEAGARLDLFLELADELDCTDPGLGFVAGRGSKPAQPQLARARRLAAAAAECVVLVPSQAQVVSRLGGAVPVVVEGERWEDAGEELDDIFLGDAEIWRRSNSEGAGPRGGDNPYVSPEGHALLDIRFDEGLKLFGEEVGYAAIAREIEGVEGVVAHGLYADVAAAAVVVGEEGQGPLELLRGQPLAIGADE